MNSTVLTVKRTNGLTPMDTDLGLLPAKRGKRLWINPLQLVEMTHALAMAEWALQLSQKLRPTLLTPVRRGRKQVYRDSSIMIVALVQVAWWLGYEEVIDYFREHSEAAQAAGFPPGRVICASQYWERRRALGILPFWWLFVAMVWQLVRMAVIQGTDLIVDATIQRTWFHDDPDAGWSFPKPGKGSVFGYKVHTVVDRWSQLPVLFLITPANHQESTVAIRLLSLVAAIFPFSIQIVRADAGYFTMPIWNFIHSVLRASPIIDYNLRRRGKRFLATRFFLSQWHFHLGPRAIIERHFAWAKRYFGLEAARWRGLTAAYQHTALVYSVMLCVAIVAYRCQRRELAGSRTRVLALKTIA
ncbi:MAG: transposase [Caldilineae bacterium]|nr:transposase [Caldilineae bacterium]